MTFNLSQSHHILWLRRQTWGQPFASLDVYNGIRSLIDLSGNNIEFTVTVCLNQLQLGFYVKPETRCQNYVTFPQGDGCKNDTPITTYTLKSKPEVEFLPISETRSSFISAVNWDVSLKFGMQIDFHTFSERSPCHRPPVCLSSVVCNVRAPYSGDWNFRQSFYAVWYLGHSLTSR